MVDHSVERPRPVAGLTGFPGRPAPTPQRSAPAPQEPVHADEVSLHTSAASILRLLRERVLAATRRLLGLPAGLLVPEFAENLVDESIPDYVGRLLSTQNQYAAFLSPPWPHLRLRKTLREAAQVGAVETVEVLAGSPAAQVCAGIVASIQSELDRRLN